MLNNINKYNVHSQNDNTITTYLVNVSHEIQLTTVFPKIYKKSLWIDNCSYIFKNLRSFNGRITLLINIIFYF